MAISFEGFTVTHREACTAAMAHHIAAMLDLDADALEEGSNLPRGWHFPLLGAQTRRRDLREDGFPGLGVPMPDLGLPRLLLAGRGVTYHADLPIGAIVRRTSTISELNQKDDQRGPRAMVTIEHTLTVEGVESPALTETQKYMLLPASGRFHEGERSVRPIEAEKSITVTPDATQLFQYSALGFNSHRIHLDRDFATQVEGYPNLVVNGGLTTLLITDYARRELGLTLRSLAMKNTAPLFADRPMTLAMVRDETGLRLRAYDDVGTLAADAEVEIA